MRRSAALAGVVLVSGCASITTGQNQPLTVETPGCNGATCKLFNDKGTWYVTATPGSTVVNRSYNGPVATTDVKPATAEPVPPEKTQ